VAVVERDGGRLQIRDEHFGSKDNEPNNNIAIDSPHWPAESAAAPRLREGHWREDQVGCVLTLESEVTATDPGPTIPAVFVEPRYALNLAQEIGQCRVPEAAPAGPPRPPAEPPPNRPGRPEVVSCTTVASRQTIEAFGPTLAATAWQEGYFQADRQGFLGDGSAANWGVWRKYFPRSVGILDFIHALGYVFSAAMAGRSFAVGWPVYVTWIGWVWSGEVARVVEALAARLAELGGPPTAGEEGSPRQIVSPSKNYF
jgi:hypothetical protein